jgi:SAM-dependent methyltransferase
MTPQPPEEILGYYALGLEQARLDESYFPLERARTRELVLRHLPPPPAVVVDVGGGPGAYALWLAGLGHEVHLFDPVPLHVQQAGRASGNGEAPRLAGAAVADARDLPFGESRADAVLMLGPLYHLTAREQRLAALLEARRVLRPGGWLFAAGISRFASLIDGLKGLVFDHDAFARIVERDLTDGQHRNDTGRAEFFTTSFFHHPDELAAEIRDAGFGLAGLFAVEGPGAFLTDFEARWASPADRERLLSLLRRVEREPALLGASPHLLAVGRRD